MWFRKNNKISAKQKLDRAGRAVIQAGSLRDEETAFKAVSGAHTIIHLESAQWWGCANDLERVELVGTRNLVTAARAARVMR